jgi:hypothetical protein
VLRCEKPKLDGLSSISGSRDALVALDWSPRVAWVADDGGQETRRRSGEGRWSEQEKMSKMCVCNAITVC